MNVEKETTAINAIHDLGCIAMELPALDPAIVLDVLNDEAAASYATAVRPVYWHFRQVISQLSGLLILCQTSPKWADRDQPMVTTARCQFREAEELRLSCNVPTVAAGHADLMRRIAEELGAVFAMLDRRCSLLDPDSSELDVGIQRLFRAHGLLLRVSDDRLDMTPVDFSNACCSCAAGRAQQ